MCAFERSEKGMEFNMNNLREVKDDLLKEWLNWICTTMGYHRINIRIDSSNTRSIKLFQKLKAIVDREEDIIYCHLDLPME